MVLVRTGLAKSSGNPGGIAFSGLSNARFPAVIALLCLLGLSGCGDPSEKARSQQRETAATPEPPKPSAEVRSPSRIRQEIDRAIVSLSPAEGAEPCTITLDGEPLYCSSAGPWPERFSERRGDAIVKVSGPASHEIWGGECRSEACILAGSVYALTSAYDLKYFTNSGSWIMDTIKDGGEPIAYRFFEVDHKTNVLKAHCFIIGATADRRKMEAICKKF